MRISITFLLLLWSCLTMAQPVNTAKLDSLFDAIIQHDKGMGSVAIRKNGKLLYTRSIGYQSVEDEQKATAHTKYRIGSITKMFTSVIIFQLIEEGKLTLDQPLSEYYPEIKNAKRITISQLLQHRSGIFNLTALPDYGEWDAQPKTEKEMVDIIKKAGTVFEPGTKSEYSNSNYVLLGYIIERVTKKSYAENVRERITAKLKLDETYVGQKTDLVKQEAYSYSFDDKWVRSSETDMSIPGAAGAILSTPSDLTIFITQLFDGKLISQTSLDSMTAIKDNYGRGIFPVPFYEYTFYGHTGGIDGFTSTLSYNEKEKLAIAYCSNGQVMRMNDILIGVLSIYFDKSYKIPTFETIPLTDEELSALSGDYSSTDIPLEIKVFAKEGVIHAQATGQSAFPLNHLGDHVFTFDAAGIRMTFMTTKGKMTLKQGGQTYNYQKK